MAVLRHGGLGVNASDSCAHLITFAAFEKTVGELARCLKIGGYLAIGHSNFRFCDSSSATLFEPVATRTLRTEKRTTPLFGSGQ